MFYTTCKPVDLGSDSAKILHATEEAARQEGTGNVLALDVRHGEQPERFYSNRTDANGYPEWSVEPRHISDERWLIMGPVPRWLVIPEDQGEPTQVAVPKPSQVNRRILQAVSDLQGDDESTLINDTGVAERIGIDLKVVRDHMELLADRGMIVDGFDNSGHAAGLTARGRIALRKANRRTPMTEEKMNPDEIQRIILQVIQDGLTSPNGSVQDSVIAEKTGLTVQDVRDHLDLLEEEDKVKLSKLLSGTVSVFLRPRGRLALKESPISTPGELHPHPEAPMKLRRIFLTHGRSPDWHEVQRYVEKTIGVETLELSEEPFMGRTILQKLEEESKKCGYAVIVMTGDDQAGETEVRARENVIHEIGFFQGRYGLDRVCLVYERGVNIPSNISGLGYVPFPKGEVRAAFADLRKEIEAAFARSGSS